MYSLLVKSDKLQVCLLLAIDVKDFSDTLEEYFEKTFEYRVILNLFGQKAGPIIDHVITNHN